MYFCYLDTNIYYERVKADSKQIVLLHGFGASSKTMQGLFYFLQKKGYDVTTVDFAGFGNSDEPKKSWTIYDYANSIKALIKHENLNEPIVLGHSFGGRVGIILASEQETRGLVLIDSAGLKPRRKINYYVSVYKYKIRKKLGLNVEKYGSKDYKTLSLVMRETFVKVVNEYLENLLGKIYCPTIILWGKNDKETPLYMAKKLNKRIKNSAQIVLDGGHFSFLDSFSQTCCILESFICSI